MKLDEEMPNEEREEQKSTLIILLSCALATARFRRLFSFFLNVVVCVKNI